MKFIKQSSIDTVLEEARIYDVVSDSESLVKKGTHYFCLSPFTKEKSPSFCVNTIKNTWFDFASGFGGNAIIFLRKKYPAMTFFEAIEKAAALCNIPLEYEEMSEDAKKLHDEEQAMKQWLEYAAEQYQKAYHKLPADAWPREMMEKGRGYTEETVQTFMIGYAPDMRDFISSPAIEHVRFEISKSLGLTKVKDGRTYDFYRDRVMFPIHNERGVIIGFGGRRSNTPEAEKYAKYMNSPESKIYHKERVLFGFWQGKKRIAEVDKAVLVEGYTDVISLHQAGLTNSVATCGTVLTPNHVRLLSRVTKNVVLFRDGDKAGISAAKRDLDILLKDGFSVSVVLCPDGEDPDTMARQVDINTFVDRNAKDAIMWLADTYREGARNPELDTLSKTLQEQHEKQVEQLRNQMAGPEALKELSAVDKQFQKNENKRLFKEIAKLERELNDTLAEFPKYEPNALAHAVDEMSNTLFNIPNKVKREQYVKMVAKTLEQKPAVLTQIIIAREEEEEKERQKRSSQAEEKEQALLGLPKGADPEQYLADRFCEIGNMYYFHNGSGFFAGTNFRIVPLFHVEGRQDNKRLCEVINERGHKRLIDFDSTDLINFTKMKERLIMEGVFYWESGATTTHFQLLAKKLLNEFITATELKILGYQREGFFAFADGVFHNNNFHPVNKYGIVHVEGLEKIGSEYRSDIAHFYSPSHSEIYKASREDDDPYENDRHFVFKRAEVSVDQWMKQMVLVFGKKGVFGVSFVLASCFRDLFILNWKYFPLLGGFGQRDSGKSGFGNCIQGFFYYNLPALELNTSTLVGISRRLTRCKNTVVFLDEYRDDMDEDKNQQLKGAWNGIGREKGKGVDTNRTSTDKINSAVYYSGQYLPARDDGALASRTMILNFEQKEFTAEEKEQYNLLMSWNKMGITSFVLDVIKHRPEVQKELTKTYSAIGRDLKAALKEVEYQNRVFENYLVPLVIVKLLESKFSMPFTYDEYFNMTREAIIENSDTISDTDGLAQFWRIVEYLADPSVKTIQENRDYQIEREMNVKYVPKKGETAVWQNKNRDEILFLSFSKVHQEYHKEATKRKDEEVISQTVIRNYLKSKKYFIGLFASRRMGEGTPSGYAFNYTEMQRLGIVNLPNMKGDPNQTSLEAELNQKPRKHQIITNQIKANYEQ